MGTQEIPTKTSAGIFHTPSAIALQVQKEEKKQNMKISVRFPPKPVPLAATRQVTQLWLFIEAIGNPSSLSE